MPRKTVDMKQVLEMGNQILASEGSTPDGREAVCAFLEGMLFETGQYAGYKYLDTSEIEGNGTRRQYFSKTL